MKKITFVLMTCGELTETDCLNSISSFRDEIEFFEVRNVYPQVKALNQMIENVQTEFFVPLDADIVLNDRAFDLIKSALEQNEHKDTWHTILFKLWDVLTEREILALKLIRTRIAKENLFSDTATPDVEHYHRLKNQGYACIDDYLSIGPIGQHIVKGHKFCYHKYKDVYQTYRLHRFDWDKQVFCGGITIKQKAENHFKFFVKKWMETNNRDYLSCIAGMLDGIHSNDYKQSKTLEGEQFFFDADHAIEDFIKWHQTYKEDNQDMQQYIF